MQACTRGGATTIPRGLQVQGAVRGSGARVGKHAQRGERRHTGEEEEEGEKRTRGAPAAAAAAAAAAVLLLCREGSTGGRARAILVCACLAGEPLPQRQSQSNPPSNTHTHTKGTTAQRTGNKTQAYAAVVFCAQPPDRAAAYRASLPPGKYDPDCAHPRKEKLLPPHTLTNCQSHPRSDASPSTTTKIFSHPRPCETHFPCGSLVTGGRRVM